MEAFRLYLQNEMIERCKSNPKYSLRAFARKLDIEPSALSKILRGKRNISKKMFQILSKKLDLSPEQVESFLDQDSKQQTKEIVERKRKQIAHDMFQVISDWYHYAILELVYLKNFKADKRWIARTLNISIPEVNVAVERLIRLGFLKIEGETWLDTSGAVTAGGDEFTSVALRKLQKQILNKSLNALEETPIEKRDHSSMTMAVDSKLLPEAKNRIKKFRRELCEFLQSSENFDHVYQLGVSLFPLTNEENIKN